MALWRLGLMDHAFGQHEPRTEAVAGPIEDRIPHPRLPFDQRFGPSAR